MLGSYHPKEPITLRLGRAIVLDLLDIAKRWGEVEEQHEPELQLNAAYKADCAASSLITRRGVPHELTVAAAASVVRWVAERVGNDDVTDRTRDDDAAVQLLMTMLDSVEYGRNPTRGIDLAEPPPPLSKREADIQTELVKLAALDDLQMRFAGAEMFISYRNFWDARTDTLMLVEAAAQLIWTVVSFHPQPDALLVQLISEIANQEVKQSEREQS